MKFTRLFVLVLACAFVAAPPAFSQSRPSAVVARPIIEPALRAAVPADFASVLRRELELALHGTQLFTLPTQDAAELDRILDQIARTGGGGRAANVDLSIIPTVTSYDLAPRRRPAPFQRENGRDLITVSGSLSLQMTVLNARNANVVARFPLDVRYTDDGRVVDAGSSFGTREAEANAYLQLAREAGRALAAHMRDRNPAPPTTTVATATTPAEAIMVAERAGSRVWLTSSQGFAVGDELSVFVGGREIRHPQTGEVLGRAEEQVGRIRIVELHSRMAVAEIVSGDVAVGATVRR